MAKKKASPKICKTEKFKTLIEDCSTSEPLEMITMIAEANKEAKEKYGDLIRRIYVELEWEYAYYEGQDYYLNLKVDRWETDEEYKSRAEADRLHQEAIENKEREEFLRLQGKYGE